MSDCDLVTARAAAARTTVEPPKGSDADRPRLCQFFSRRPRAGASGASGAGTAPGIFAALSLLGARHRLGGPEAALRRLLAAGLSPVAIGRGLGIDSVPVRLWADAMGIASTYPAPRIVRAARAAGAPSLAYFLAARALRPRARQIARELGVDRTTTAAYVRAYLAGREELARLARPPRALAWLARLARARFEMGAAVHRAVCVAGAAGLGRSKGGAR